MNKLLISIIIVLLLLGCSSTTVYIPPKDHKVYLSIIDGELTLMKDSVLINLVTDDSLIADWDSLPRLMINQSLELYSFGQLNTSAAAGLAVIFFPAAIILGVHGENEINTARAKFIDAMNIQNDNYIFRDYEGHKSD
jgi:hypothetical protein